MMMMMVRNIVISLKYVLLGATPHPKFTYVALLRFVQSHWFQVMPQSMLVMRPWYVRQPCVQGASDGFGWRTTGC